MTIYLESGTILHSYTFIRNMSALALHEARAQYEQLSFSLTSQYLTDVERIRLARERGVLTSEVPDIGEVAYQSDLFSLRWTTCLLEDRSDKLDQRLAALGE